MVNMSAKVEEEAQNGLVSIVFTSLLVPYRWNRRGGIDFLAVCQSIRPSVSLYVSPLSVRPLGFPNFSQSSFEILTWNLENESIRVQKNWGQILEIKLKISCSIILYA